MSLNIEIIRESFERVKPIAETAAKTFYKNLFADYPEAKELFSNTNMPKQRKALINSLVFIVDHLDSEDKLINYLKKMGARHVAYGTEEEHYSWVGNSLIKTLAGAFGEDWTDAIEDQWIMAFNFIADVMQKGAKESELDNVVSLTEGGVIKVKLPPVFEKLIRNEIKKALHNELENSIRTIYQQEIEKLKDPEEIRQYIKKVS